MITLRQRLGVSAVVQHTASDIPESSAHEMSEIARTTSTRAPSPPSAAATTSSSACSASLPPPPCSRA
eukprot:356782-Chlamydomonas_euryale.AAC.1